MPLAQRLARQVKGPSIPRDDLEAEAYAALVEAAQSYDPDRGVHFAVYCRPRIIGAMRDYRRFLFHANWRGESGEMPVFQRLSVFDDLHGRVLGKEPEAPCGWGPETLEAMKSAIRHLPRLNSIACRLMYFEGKSHEETADILGFSSGHLTRLHNDAIAQLARDHGELLAG